MKSILFACAAMAVATGANAATVLYDFSLAPHQNDLGTTETYTVSGLSIVASGFSWGTHPAPIDLWGKHGGGDENGLGLANDPTGDYEIHYHSGFVQLDVSGLFGKVLAGSTTFGTNSTTGGEAWAVYGTNTAGSLVGATQVVTGSSEVTNQLLPNLGTYKYYDFVETSTLGGKNFLITKLTTVTTAAPEPASWMMMIVGFGGLGAILRRRRAQANVVAA